MKNFELGIFELNSSNTRDIVVMVLMVPPRRTGVMVPKPGNFMDIFLYAFFEFARNKSRRGTEPV